MADSTLSALTAATTPLAGTEDLYIVQGGTSKKVAASAFQAPLVSGTNIKTVNGSSLLGSGDLTVSASAGGANTQVQFNNSGELGGDAGLTYNSTTGGLTLSGKTVTTSNPVIDASQTWNNSGVTFTGIKFNVTDTASAAGSLLMDLRVGGVSRFAVRKNGSAFLSSSDPTSSTNFATSSYNLNIQVYSGSGFDFSTNAGFRTPGGLAIGTNFTNVVRIDRDADNILAQRNGVNAQTNRLYGTYTDASNYRRLTKTMSAAGVAEIKPEGAGTGATGNVLYISGLPTSNPGPGILWNNGGVVNVGT